MPGIEILVILLMVGLNSLFAAYELALASVKAHRLKVLVEQHRRGAKAALWMKSRMEASLAVVQLGITLVGAIAAATGGAEAGETLAPWLVQSLGMPEGLAGIAALALVVVPLSALTIIVGELIPKVFAIKNSEWVCVTFSPAMYVFAAVAFPIVWCFETVTKLVIATLEKIFPAAAAAEGQTSLAELRAQVSLLRASKVIGLQEERIILQASRLSGMKVDDILVPAEDIVMLQADRPLSENLVTAHLDLHTRFPVTEVKGDPQSIVGYVNFKEMIVLAKTHPWNPSLREIIRPLIGLPMRLPVSDALRRMLVEHLHLALVRDEEGQVTGMITLEDVFEELVGDIEDEFDRLPRNITPSGRQWVIGGGATLARLREAIHRPDLGGELPGQVTLNDWLHRNREDWLKGGDTVEVDGVWILVRKVRRKKVTEALLDPEGSPTARSADLEARAAETK